MNQGLFAAAVVIGLLRVAAPAHGETTGAFVDGLWTGGAETSPASTSPTECWASTTFDDGTTLTLAEGRQSDWSLRLSNPAWQLPSPYRYDMVVQVDFYRRIRTMADVRSPTRLDIVQLEQTSLLWFIENGHFIALASDGFTEKYSLEGSAKIIQRIRNCFAD